MTADASHKTRTLWLVGVLHAFTHAYHVALMPLYLLIQRDFGFKSVGQATALVTVMMAGNFIPAYWMGVLADRVSRKKLLGLGLFINALGYVALAFAPNFGWALVAVAVSGFGGSFYHPAATAMIARMFPVGTGKALGLTGIGASVGFFAGPVYAGWRAMQLAPALGDAAWRRPVMEFGVLGLIAAIVFMLLADEDKPAPAAERVIASRVKMFPTPALWMLFFVAAFAFSLRDFAGSSMGSLGSLFLQHAHNYDTRDAGLALSWIFLPSAVSNPLFGHLSDGGRKRWAAFVLLTAAVLVVIFPHVPSGWVIPVFLVYGFFFMSSYPIVEAELMQSVPDAVRGRVFGLFITVGGFIGNASHWIVGELVRGMGEGANHSRNYFWIYAVLGLMIVLSVFGLRCLGAVRTREQIAVKGDAS
ncbi:MAG: MFS transporter [Verrucomicrobia bacterium]|nr:MFS transporter [Verrucomicrobiota bacterium]